MADDVKVTIGAESSGATSEFQKVGKQIENLRNSGKKLGGVLEGDRRVENKLTSWVQGLTNARNAADVLASTLGDLGDVFKTSLVLGAGLNIGAVLVQGLADAIAKVSKFKEELNEIGKSVSVAVASMDEGGMLGITSQLNEKIKEMNAGFLNWTPEIIKATTQIQQLGNALLDIKDDELEILRATLDGDEKRVEYLNKRKALIEFEAKMRKAGVEESVIQAALVMEGQRLGLISEIVQKKKDEAEADKEAAEATKEKAELEKAAQAEAERYFQEYWEGVKQKEASEKEAVNSIISFHQQKWKDYWAWFQGELDKQVKEKETKENQANLAKAQAQLPGAEGAVRRAEALVDQVQGQRQAAGDIGLFKRGASMSEQRSSQRFYQRQAEINAGVVARDEFRRKVGGDADKMDAMKGEIENRRKQILGEAGANNPEAILERSKTHLQEIEKQITQLNKKLGKA